MKYFSLYCLPNQFPVCCTLYESVENEMTDALLRNYCLSIYTEDNNKVDFSNLYFSILVL